jgi:hypothetical protein
MIKNKSVVKKSVSKKIVGKQKTQTPVNSFLLKAQKFLESKKFRVTEIRSRSVHFVAFLMKSGVKLNQEIKGSVVFKEMNSSLPLFGSDTRKAGEIYSGKKIKKLHLKAGNPNLCESVMFTK